MTTFVHLHVRSEFSLKDSIVRISDLVKTTLKAGMPSVAVTDLMNLYGLVKFYKSAQGKGLKPVFGSDLVVRDGDQLFEVTALVMNEAGYSSLIRVISDAFINGQEMGEPIASRQMLERCHEGLILLLGKRSDVGMALSGADQKVARDRLLPWMHMFPQRVYLELVRTGREGEEDFLHAAVALGDALQCPVVATNDVRFLSQEDFEAHEVRVCIAQSYVLDDPRRINTIIQMGFPGYFLIVMDFIRGPKTTACRSARGTRLGRRSLVAYCAENHRPGSAALRPAV
jgi:DNA polymerase-3 subunit alpha